MITRLKTAGRAGVLLATLLLLQACATMGPAYEEPTVMLSSFRAVPSEGMVPSFEVGLRILNPNSTPLDIEGVVYSISLQGHELVKGVGKGYPRIDGYSEGDITLTASANLLNGIRLITTMTQQAGEPLEYEFKARLDISGRYSPVRISETGTLDMGARLGG